MLAAMFAAQAIPGKSVRHAVRGGRMPGECLLRAVDIVVMMFRQRQLDQKREPQLGSAQQLPPGELIRQAH